MAVRLAPTVCVFMCVNTLTTCPDGKVETFTDSALEEFTWWWDFLTSVELSAVLTFWSHSESSLDISLSPQRSGSLFLSNFAQK